MKTEFKPFLTNIAQLAQCDNCTWQDASWRTLPIQSASERLTAGEEIPAGACPDCGACCYLITEDTDA